MARQEPANDAGTAIAPGVEWSLAAFALAALALHFLTNAGYNYFRDELYYIACGRHLDWGYVDHPPLIALVARASEIIFGPSLRGLRFLPSVCAAMTTFLAGLMARDLGGRRFAQLLAAGAALAAPIYLIGFTTLTMNAFEIVWWALICWLLVRVLNGGDGRLWLAVGAVIGVAFLTKHSVLFLLAGVAVGLVVQRDLRHLGSKWLWFGALIAALFAAPHLLWQVRHGWPTLEFMENARRLKNAPVSAPEFFAGQVLLMHPLAAPLWLAGLWAMFVGVLRRYRVFAWAYVFMFVLFVTTRGKVYYLAGIYPVLFAAGAVALERWTERARRVRAAYAVSLGFTAALLAPAVLPALPPSTLEAYLDALHLSEPAMEQHRPARLPQVFADMFGWEEMVARVARAYHSLPPHERARCAIFASNYGEAGAIDFYGPKYGLPPAVSGHNSYFLWGPPADGRGDVVLTIGESREDVERTYIEVTEVDRTNSPFAMPYENDVPIFLGRRPKATLPAIWPRCKEYI